MRLWSLHPCYLDARGLVALWREALLAKKVLKGKTKGYRMHPQLERFRQTENPVMAINQYLSELFIEAEKRGYKFNKNKIDGNFTPVKIPVTTGQMNFEAEHLKRKLMERDHEKYKEFLKIKKVRVHTLFRIVKGDIESWEKAKSDSTAIELPII